MKIFCRTCGEFGVVNIEPLKYHGDEIIGDIVCSVCECPITTLQCDDFEYEYDPDPCGYYDICKAKDYYPNGG